MKRIVLCADDYGQTEAISCGILSLLKKNRLTATSCIVNSADWVSWGDHLRPLKDQVDVGLHFNLTEGKALSKQYIAYYGNDFMPLKRLLASVYLRKMEHRVIEAELQAQLDSFTAVTGYLPRFIDGHQHIHQLPIIRHALVKVYLERLDAAKTYIRLPYGKITYRDFVKNTKKIIINAIGANRLACLLIQNKIYHNRSFAGVYNFSQASQYHRVFKYFLNEIEDRGLIMCHPGLISSGDSISNARYDEYLYFCSAQFIEDCKRHQILLSPFLF